MLPTKFVEHRLSNSSTISAAIKLYNGHHLAKDEIEALLRQYDILNNHQIPRPGQTVKIPVYED